MKLILDSAQLENGKLVISGAVWQLSEFARKFKPGTYELKKEKKIRSLTSNSYAWVLIHAIADVTRLPPEEVYKDAVKGIGNNYEVVCIQNSAVDAFRKMWSAKGLGWQSEIADSKIDGCTNLFLYYGSSVFDTSQMSKLIDSLVQDCIALGIETKSREEIDSLLSQWEDVRYDK